MTKVTQGYVEQTFDNDGNFISQRFFAEGEVEYIDTDTFKGNPLETYEPFDMVQPTKE